MTSCASLRALSTCQLRAQKHLKPCDTGDMMSDTARPSYTGFRFPQEIISHAVWLYFRFNLSLRDVEALLAARGMIVTYETMRQWWGCRWW